MATNTWISCRESSLIWCTICADICCVEIQMTRRCLQNDLHCPNKSTVTACQLREIFCSAFWVDGWVLTEVQYKSTLDPDQSRQSQTLQTFREMAGLYNTESKQHNDASVPRMKKDEHDVHKVKNTIERWVNPFKSRETNEPLSNIASGVKATYDIADHLLTVDQKGNDAFTTFVEKILQTSDVDLFAPLSKAKLQTFQNVVRSNKIKVAKNDIIIKAGRGLFARMVVIAQHRRMNMQDVLNYPLGPLPWYIANRDGAPAKEKLRCFTCSHTWWKGWSCWSCAILRRVDPVWKCFATSTEILLQDIQRASQGQASLGEIDLVQAQHIRTDLIMDQCPAISIKNPERTNRSAGEAIQIKIQGGSQKWSTPWNKCVMAEISQTWQPFVCKSSSSHTAEQCLPALVNCMWPMVRNATSCLLGRKASATVGGRTMHTARESRHPHPTACQSCII